MAKEYQSPSKRKEEEDEDLRKEELRKQQQSQAQRQAGQDQDQTATDQVNKEAQEQSEKAAKERSAYMNEMNRRIEEVVNYASQHKDNNPQLLNLTSEALKSAACQIDAATPQGVTRQREESGRGQGPSMR